MLLTHYFNAMNPFRKSRGTLHNNNVQSKTVNDTYCMSVKEVKDKKSNSSSTMFAIIKKRSIRDVAKELGMPKDENYKLETMLRSGNIPQEVPVSGMLDRTDALDNISLASQSIDKLIEIRKSSKDTAVTDPTPVADPIDNNVTPSNQ